MKDTAVIGFQDAWAREPWGTRPSNRTLIFPPAARDGPHRVAAHISWTFTGR